MSEIVQFECYTMHGHPYWDERPRWRLTGNKRCAYRPDGKPTGEQQYEVEVEFDERTGIWPFGSLRAVKEMRWINAGRVRILRECE